LSVYNAITYCRISDSLSEVKDGLRIGLGFVSGVDKRVLDNKPRPVEDRVRKLE